MSLWTASWRRGWAPLGHCMQPGNSLCMPPACPQHGPVIAPDPFALLSAVSSNMHQEPPVAHRINARSNLAFPRDPPRLSDECEHETRQTVWSTSRTYPAAKVAASVLSALPVATGRCVHPLGSRESPRAPHNACAHRSRNTKTRLWLGAEGASRGCFNQCITFAGSCQQRIKSAGLGWERAAGTGALRTGARPGCGQRPGTPAHLLGSRKKEGGRLAGRRVCI